MNLYDKRDLPKLDQKWDVWCIKKTHKGIRNISDPPRPTPLLCVAAFESIDNSFSSHSISNDWQIQWGCSDKVAMFKECLELNMPIFWDYIRVPKTDRFKKPQACGVCCRLSSIKMKAS